jgi:hypothetical protein
MSDEHAPRWQNSFAVISLVLGIASVATLAYALAASWDTPFTMPFALSIGAIVAGVVGIWSSRRISAAAGILGGVVVFAVFLLMLWRL